MKTTEEILDNLIKIQRLHYNNSQENKELIQDELENCIRLVKFLTN